MRPGLLSSFSVSFLICLLIIGCDEGRLGYDDPERPTIEDDASTGDTSPDPDPLPSDPATVVEGAERPPAFIMATADKDWEARPAPTVEEAATLLRDDPELAPLAEALAEAGWDDEEAATLFALGAGYGSGQPHDPVRARSVEFHNALNDAIGSMHEELDEFEDAEGIVIDRSALPRVVEDSLPVVP